MVISHKTAQCGHGGVSSQSLYVLFKIRKKTNITLGFTDSA